MDIYDLIIIGIGPAGMTASIYASCFKLNHILIGQVPGGQMSLAPDIVNYPGFEEISGGDLTEKMLTQVKKRGAEVIIDAVTSLTKKDEGFTVTTVSGKTYQAKTIILATGVERRKLGVPGEIAYTGKGVQYCASCEKFDYEGKITTVVGGANAAAQTAVQLSHAAKKVYIIYRGTQLRCDPIWQAQIQDNPHIEVIYNSQVKEIIGNGKEVTGIKIEKTDPLTKQYTVEDITVDRIYIEIGGVPGTALLIPIGVSIDAGGYIAVDEFLTTSVKGVFAAGDVVSHKYSIEQISSAVGSGARGARSVFSYLKQENAPTLWGKYQIKRPT